MLSFISTNVDKPSPSTVGRCSLSVSGRKWWEKVLDPLDLVNQTKKAFNSNMDAVKEWAKKVKKDPVWLLTPPLPRTGNKTFDKKVLEEIEKVKRMADTMTLNPIKAAKEIKKEIDNSSKGKGGAEADRLYEKQIQNQQLEKEKKRNETLMQDMNVFKSMFDKIQNDTGVYLNSCPEDFNQTAKYSIDRKDYVRCQFTAPVKTKALTWDERRKLKAVRGFYDLDIDF